MNDTSHKKADTVTPAEGCIWGACWLAILVIGVFSLLGYFTGFISLTTLGVSLGTAAVIWFGAKLQIRRVHSRFVRMSEERQDLRNERARQALLRLMDGQ